MPIMQMFELCSSCPDILSGAGTTVALGPSSLVTFTCDVHWQETSLNPGVERPSSIKGNISVVNILKDWFPQLRCCSMALGIRQC